MDPSLFTYSRLVLALATLSFLPNAHAQQEVCDSLNIIAVQYAPFYGTDLQVTVANPTSVLFSYPVFSLLDTEGDTLVREQLNFFGLGTQPSVHDMAPVPGMPQVLTPFTGELLLNYVDQDGVHACTFPIVADLCPPAPCGPLEVYLITQGGGAAVTATVDWSITNEGGDAVSNGVFHLDADGQQQDVQDICLPSGAYTLHASQQEAIGTEFAIGVAQYDLALPGPSEALQPGGTADRPFDFHPACFGAGHMGVQEAAPNEIRFAQEGRSIRITSTTATALGRIGLFDSTGRCLRNFSSGSSTATIDLSSVASGAYLLRSLEKNAWPVQRFVLP